MRSKPQTPFHRFKSEELRVDPGPPRMLAPAGVDSFAITLGTSTPSPNPFRFGAAGAVLVADEPYLIDAGEGILRAIARAAAAHDNQFVDCFAPQKLTRLFLTHLHSDHTVGLPSLLLFPWIFGKEEPLEIWGPLGTQSLVENILLAYRSDIAERVHGPERANDTGWRAKVHEFSTSGTVYEDQKIRVEAFSHQHGNMQNYGFRFTTPDRVLVWAGDGKASEPFQEAASNADVLITEICTEAQLDNAPWGGASAQEKEAIIWSYHIKPSELANLAVKARVETLVLLHESNYSIPYHPLALEDEFKQIYNGIVVSSRDGDVF